MKSQLLFVAVCLVVPIAWGVLVNWLFDVVRRQREERPDEDHYFPDYQI